MKNNFDARYRMEHESLTLDKSKQKELENWVDIRCMKQPEINHDHDSYGLKHCAQRELGFYVSNADMKKAMKTMGFKVEDENELNWKFNISNDSVCYTWPKAGTHDKT